MAMRSSLSMVIGLICSVTLACSGEDDGSGADQPSGGASGHGSAAVQPAEVIESGLCSLALTCSQEITDSPATNCALQVREPGGNLVYDDHAAVEIRGRTSRGFPKKNYDVELRTAGDLDNPVNLLGMGKDEDWVLDGAWADRSFMRNRLTFSLFREAQAGQWAPEVRYCELKINSRNAGVYALLQKVKRDDDRVIIPEDDGTGQSFIVRQKEDGTLSLPFGLTDKWSLVYPNKNVATSVQTQSIQRWLDNVSGALRGRGSATLTDLFDVDKIVDWILVEEFAKNIDAYNLSVYLVRGSDSKAWVVPWDIDLGYGQPTDRRTRDNEAPTGWIAHRTDLIAKLSGVAAIRAKLGSRWRALRSGILSNDAVLSRLDAYERVLSAEVIARNFALWPIQDVDFQPYYGEYSFYDVSSYDEELAHLRDWIERRLDYMDANIDSYPSN